MRLQLCVSNISVCTVFLSNLILFVYRMAYIVIVERVKGTTSPFYRPPLPRQESEGVHPGILTLMKQCWAEEPSERPSFVQVAKSLTIINEGKSVGQIVSVIAYSCSSNRHIILTGVINERSQKRSLWAFLARELRVRKLWTSLKKLRIFQSQ